MIYRLRNLMYLILVLVMASCALASPVAMSRGQILIPGSSALDFNPATAVLTLNGTIAGTGLTLTAPIFSTATISNLTSGRIPIAGAAGLLATDADLTFATDTLTATKIIGSTSITDSGLTAGRLTLAGTAGLLTDDADLMFAVDTLTVTKLVGSTSITDSGLTAGRLTFAGTAGLLTDDSDLTFSGSTLTATNVVVSAGITLPVSSTAVFTAVPASQSGTTFISTAVDTVFQLPATQAGLRYTFISKAPSGGAGMKVSPVAADKIMGTAGTVAFTSADDKDAINTGATDAEGDSITLVGDGVDGWFIVSSTGVWARE